MPAYLNITGQRFGRLIALKDVGRKNGTALWQCHCDCGKKTIVLLGSLRSGNTSSCGCLSRIEPNARTHGKSGVNRTPEYNSWALMHKRCANPNDPRFKHYGGRGIEVCERWDSFENFLADMGSRPKDYSIERINVDGNYEPSNCKWIPKREQAKNRRPFKRRAIAGTA